MRFLPRRASLGRRLFYAVASMLLPLVAVAGLRILTFRTTAAALEEFRAETVGESLLIAQVRDLLGRVDDAGETYVETADRRWVSVSSSSASRSKRASTPSRV
jgi:hypothetical protein